MLRGGEYVFLTSRCPCEVRTLPTPRVFLSHFCFVVFFVKAKGVVAIFLNMYAWASQCFPEYERCILGRLMHHISRLYLVALCRKACVFDVLLRR